jgi:micrococcal nuclease
MYHYKARIVNVVDGDTIDADVSLGFYMTARIRFRLARIDTPEMNSKILEERAQAARARNRVNELILYKDVTIKTFKTDKYGRWLAEVYLPDGSNVSDTLLLEELAVPYT